VVDGRVVVGGFATVVVVTGPVPVVGVVVEDRVVVGAVVAGRVVTVGVGCWIPEAMAAPTALPVFAAVVIDLLAPVVGAPDSDWFLLPEPRDASRAEAAVSSPSVSSRAAEGGWLRMLANSATPSWSDSKARLGSKPLVTMMATSAAEPVNIPARRREPSSSRFTLNRRPFVMATADYRRVTNIG